ncbi:unnamed protein product, partial [Rhizoctonia solani]
MAGQNKAFGTYSLPRSFERNANMLMLNKCVVRRNRIKRKRALLCNLRNLPLKGNSIPKIMRGPYKTIQATIDHPATLRQPLSDAGVGLWTPFQELGVPYTNSAIRRARSKMCTV